MTFALPRIGVQVGCTRKIGREHRCDFPVRAPWGAIRVCGDYLVVPAVLIRDTVQGGIYIVLERGFRKAHVVYITSPHRLLGALQKREVLVGLWKLCGGLRREDPEPGRETWRYRHRKRSDWEWERRFGKVLFAALTENVSRLGAVWFAYAKFFFHHRDRR